MGRERVDRRRRFPVSGALGLLIGLSACVAADGPGQPEPGGSRNDSSTVAASGAGGAAALVPAGHGTLRQDEITIQLRSGPLQIKVTPLAESVTRLTAPDTYRRLSALARSRRAEATGRVPFGEPALFLVSFFSYEPNAVFQPEDVQIGHQGRLLRPLAILPVTPGWGRQRLDQQETQMAVYAFDGDIEFDLPLLLRYGLSESDAWARILRTLELERAKVRARAG